MPTGTLTMLIPLCSRQFGAHEMSEESLAEVRLFTDGGISVGRRREILPPFAFDQLRSSVDDRLGGVFESRYAHAGRYSERSVGFVDPLLRLTAVRSVVSVELLDRSATGVFAHLSAALSDNLSRAVSLTVSATQVVVAFAPPMAPAVEETRTRVASPFDVVRAILDFFRLEGDNLLGLYGAFGYDSVFYFETSIKRRMKRREDQRDFVLYVPRSVLVTYPDMDYVVRTSYDFRTPEGHPASDGGVRRGPVGESAAAGENSSSVMDFASGIAKAQDAFARGDLFEVVLSQVFDRRFEGRPSEIHARLLTQNQSPYASHLNLGGGEHLVISSPEMYLRVKGTTIESAPIAGTVSRGGSAIEDFRNLRDLLLSDKDDAELMMCTDVDRNDKARVSEPGSIVVVGHREVEIASRVMHTVEHITATLRRDKTSLDAFISHMWAVTVTGAPKIAAMQFIEDTESSPRGWYSGAFGRLLFNGDIDSGSTIRAIHLTGTTARVRVGNSLLARSVTSNELAECHLKAAALLDALDCAPVGLRPPVRVTPRAVRTVLIDHEDSFVHTLGDYLRRGGCNVTTIRSVRGRGVDDDDLLDLAPDFICLSPGPGSPNEFHINRTLEYARRQGVPVFGVCLGMQAIGEYLGGALRQLPTPAHGVRSVVHREVQSELLADLPDAFEVGRYHSLHIDEASLSDRGLVSARSEDGIVMAIESPRNNLFGVQFHPESIMSATSSHGQTIVDRAVRLASDLRIEGAS